MLCTVAMLWSMLPAQVFAEDPLTEDDQTAGITPLAAVDVTNITLDQLQLAMTVGDPPVQLNATVEPSDATDTTVEWKSDDVNVATVTDGTVTAVSAGVATITATATNGTPNDPSDDKTATCTVTVSDPAAPAVTSVEILLPDGRPMPDDHTIQYGESLSLDVQVSPQGATPALEWSSTDPSVATVDPSGVVNVLKAGTTGISVQVAGDDSITDKFNLIVEKTKVSIISVSFRDKIYDGTTDVSACLDQLVLQTDSGTKVETEVNGLTWNMTDSAVGNGKTVEFSGSPEFADSEMGDCYELSPLQPGFTGTINILPAPLTASMQQELTYNGKQEGYTEEVTFSGFVEGDESRTLSVRLYDQNNRAIQAGSNVTATIDYTTAGNRDTTNYTWPDTVTIPQVKPAEILFKVEVAEKNYDGNTDVEAINKNDLLGRLVGDDTGTVSNTLQPSDLELSEAGKINEDVSGVSVNLKDGAVVGVLIDGQPTSNYSAKLEFDGANIKHNQVEEDREFSLDTAVYVSDDDVRWYQGNTVTVTANSGYMVSDQENGTYKSSANLKLVDGRLTVYVKNTTNGTLAKAVIQNVRVDGSDPEIKLTSTEALKYDNDKVEYTFEVSDDGSGVALDTLEYYVGAVQSDVSGISNWVNATAEPTEVKNIYQFTVTAPAAPNVTTGYVYVRVADNTQNYGYVGGITALVLEKNAPTLDVKCNDAATPAQSHTVQLTAQDGDASAGAPYPYSGIQQISYKLTQGDTEALSNTIKTSEPLEMEDIANNREKSETVKFERDKDGDPLDGEYTLTVTATDYCGNSTEKTLELVFDNTAPEVTVAMGKTEADDDQGDYYYNGQACGITVTFADTNLDQAGGQYTVNVADASGAFDKTYTLADTRTGVLSIPVDAFATAPDGMYTISVVAVDGAGNAARKMTEETIGVRVEESEEESEKMKALFYLDNTEPVLKSVSLTQGNYYAGDQAVYYNGEFGVEFVVEEANLQTKGQASYVALETQAAPEAGTPAMTTDDNKTTLHISATVAKQADISNAAYSTELVVVDKAGNLLVLDPDLVQDDVNAVTYLADEGKVTLDNQLVLDTVAPIAELSYTNLDDSHYYVEGQTTNAYYNQPLQVRYAFYDASGLDETKLSVSQYKDGQVMADGTLGDEPYGATEMEVAKAVPAQQDANGRYRFGAYGTDKAGNPLTVREAQTTGDSAEVLVVTGCQDAYLSPYEKVMDTVSPTYTLDVTGPAADNAAAIDGTTVYMNTDITATFTVDEVNFDQGMIGTAAASVTNTDNYSTAQPAWVDVALTKSETYEGTTYTQTVQADGVYRFEICGYDKAGNPLVPSAEEAAKDGWNATVANGQAQYWTYNKIRDTKAPSLTVSFNDGTEFYTAVLGEPGDGTVSSYYSVSANMPYRRSSSATGTLTKSDCSPVSVAYSIQSTTAPQSETGSAYNYDPLTIQFNGEQIYYIQSLQIRDRAGNVSTMPKASNKIYLDVTAPDVDELVPTVSLVAHVSGEGRGTAGTDLYNGNVTVRATVTDPGEGVRSSGLYHVYYKVLVNDGDWTDKVGVSTKGSQTAAGVLGYGTSGKDYASAPDAVDETVVSQDVIDFSFDANTFNYNDVKIFVWAEDNSGNLLSEAEAAHYYFGIDITSPTIEVSYDNNEAQNEKYFKADRTATVVITERNFDPDNTVITTQSEASISGWTYAAGGLDNGDDDTWTCTVTYSEDGDYTFDVTTVDLVGHDGGAADYGDSVAPQEFTIDKTKPIIRISFDNNDVRNGKYYNEARIATVTIEEHNFSTEGVDLTTTANIQEGSVAAPTAGGWSDGGDTHTAHVNFTEDGNYTMHVEYVDLAGNEAEPEDVEEFVVDTTAPELEITGVEDKMAYSGDVAPVITYHDINYDNSSAGVSIQGYKHPEGANLTGTRTEDAFGGSFTCDNIEPVKENDDVYTATGSVSDLAGNETEVTVVFSVNRFGSTYLFGEDTQDLLDKYYTNNPQALHVTEINVDSLTQNRVTTSLNGELTTLQEGSDYTVTESVPGWHQFDYTINADNFSDEGAYDVTLTSQDEAGNSSSNRAVKEDGNQTSDMPINFVVDMTPPVNVVTGVDNNEQYVEAERSIMINFDDNTAVESLTLYINDEAVAEYDAEALKSANGVIQYVAKASNRWQQFKVVSVDVAGNVSDETTLRYLLTSNLLVQYYNNKPLFYGSLAILAVAIVFVILLVKRRKSKEERSVNV